MFTPSKDDVRRFFCTAWAKHLAQAPLEPIEGLAVDWIVQHPEYHDDLDDIEKAVTADYGVDQGRTNPFLHLSMHLSIEEQLSIDQPPGIRGAFDRLAQRLDSRHEAMHAVMECLGEVLWRAQRDSAPVDGAAYVEAVNRRAQR
ncbi:MAG: hypothetical protein RLZZ281_542 [Pseudomonadota bacterium]|jgi:hypothetical protein